VTQLKDFKYQHLTPRQLARLVYDLNKALVFEMGNGNSEDPKHMELREKAVRVINRARLEGIL